jgi:hypothetical protein
MAFTQPIHWISQLTGRILNRKRREKEDQDNEHYPCVMKEIKLLLFVLETGLFLLFLSSMIVKFKHHQVEYSIHPSPPLLIATIPNTSYCLPHYVVFKKIFL